MQGFGDAVAEMVGRRLVIAAVVLLLIGGAIGWIVSRPAPTGDTYSTPNGEFPRERTYLR